MQWPSKLYLPFKVRPKCQVKSVQYGFCTSGLTCEKKQHVPRLVNFLLIFVTKMTTKEMKIAKNCLKMLWLLNILFFVQKRIDLSKHHNHQHSIIIIITLHIITLTKCRPGSCIQEQVNSRPKVNCKMNFGKALPTV